MTTVTLNGRSYQQADLTCPELGCGAPMRLRYTPKFGGRVFYGCTAWPRCLGVHGAHQANGLPLGTPARPDVKALRMQAHAAFDPLWQQGHMGRQAAYRWLTEALGLERQVHIGASDEALCRRIVELSTAKFGELQAAREGRAGEER